MTVQMIVAVLRQEAGHNYAEWGDAAGAGCRAMANYLEAHEAALTAELARLRAGLQHIEEEMRARIIHSTDKNGKAWAERVAALRAEPGP